MFALAPSYHVIIKTRPIFSIHSHHFTLYVLLRFFDFHCPYILFLSFASFLFFSFLSLYFYIFPLCMSVSFFSTFISFHFLFFAFCSLCHFHFATLSKRTLCVVPCVSTSSSSSPFPSRSLGGILSSGFALSLPTTDPVEFFFRQKCLTFSFLQHSSHRCEQQLLFATFKFSLFSLNFSLLFIHYLFFSL